MSVSDRDTRKGTISNIVLFSLQVFFFIRDDLTHFVEDSSGSKMKNKFLLDIIQI